MSDPTNTFVSRAGAKLEHALNHFGLDVAGKVCADLGCSTGGFTDCLLQRGAAKVYSVDTAYGELAWKLRQDPRVVVLERTNAIHFNPKARHTEPAPPPTPPRETRRRGKAGRRTDKPHPSHKLIPQDFQGVDLVVIDLGWTKQSRALPAARHWLNPQGEGHVITLIKPHYESGEHQLEDERALQITQTVLAEITADGWHVAGHVASPIAGGKGGNLEVLAYLRAEHLQPRAGDL